MAGQREREPGRVAERSKREQRADRIMDAAAGLMLRWGYNKTTVDDIARSAGVAKGTIYLYWKTREDLFLALMAREYLRLIVDIRERVAADPDGGTIYAITKHSMLATLKNPLVKAVLLRDSDLLGEWTVNEVARKTYPQQVAQSLALIDLYRSLGVVRDDLDAIQLVSMIGAIIIGFFMKDKYLPSPFTSSDEELAEMAAEVVSRAFAPAHATPPDEATKQELAQRFLGSLDDILALRSGQPEA